MNAKCERLSFDVEGEFGVKKIAHALAVSNLDLPIQSFCNELSQYVEHRTGINVKTYFNARPLILIGQDNWQFLEVQESRIVKDSGLIVSRSELGWTVHGYIEQSKIVRVNSNVHAMLSISNPSESSEQNSLANLDRLIHQYFELENLGVAATSIKKDQEERAINILRMTTRKIGKQWETGLLWKSDSIPDIDSKATALKRLHSLERKLDRNPAFASLYYREMQRLIDNKYVVKVSKDLRRPRIWYVPHFGVENINKPNKVRLVFDAAAKTGGVSLNDQLETGPDLLESLIGVLLRFRQYSIAVKADIKDMYLRVKIIESDRGAQRFLWRNKDRNREPDIYENTSLFFGSKSSPCSAIYVKNLNAERFANWKPEAAASIKRNSYMDDFLVSGKYVNEMRKQIRDVIAINSEASLEMHGWASNDSRVVEDVRRENQLGKDGKVSLCDEEERVLGLYWDRNNDMLSFNVGLKKIRDKLLTGSVKPTKREFYSVVMSVYDPLGILSPFTLQARFLMQDICRSGVKWDGRIREEEGELWETWLRNLSEIKHCKIPRCMFPLSEYKNVQLHVFCDASLKAYATVGYLRLETSDRRIQIFLIMAKARVLPLKPMTVPRAELQAALLGARLASNIIKELDAVVNERIFWSDSTTVLQWIRANPREKQMFVANRLSEIGGLTKTSEWRWVPSRLNPADDATRTTSEPMRSTDRWLVGPDWLRSLPDSWPKQKALQEKEVREIRELESRKQFIGAIFLNDPEKCIVSVRSRIMGWVSIRKIAECVRKIFFIWRQNALKIREKSLTLKRHRLIQPLACVEGKSPEDRISHAEKFWYRDIQATYFPLELELIQKSKPILRGSKLIGLNAFVDQEGILRARGRTSKVSSAWYQNQPIILDASHFATKLLIHEFHRRFDHQNNETVINELRQQFYIVGLRTRLRSLAMRCLICRMRRARPVNPPMADLPKCRTAYYQRPFTHCGIDYFGPMFVKIGRRREKRWGVLFTCMSTRAIHVELANTLSASSTILAIERLAGRRGCPQVMYSDNATNFVKARKELDDAVVAIKPEDLQQFAAKKRFRWRFNPPDAPHMGGAWERLIRSVKTALYHALGDQAPFEEVLSTLLIEIEHMINSRPLTHVSVDPRDKEALTPNHFLLGSSSGYLRLERFESEISNPRKTFEIAQNLAKKFWDRWLREYLPTLLPRKKWHKLTPPLQVGDYVLIVDFQTPRNVWNKGRITEVFTNNSDNVTRVAKVRVRKKEFVRPVHKLIKIFSPTESKIE
ncbi:uncharacterized protein LOC131671423 [Phymastichus coffea]|uniref:uncharacterized protein LOC131671423 n=1 Tax=Phymastichus coffea TaxID=108790 RepID=UPI00273C23AF|nr:uncharacterized protein LOC131671423 [Phymastichus coffea]